MPPEDDNLSPDERSTQELVERIESVNRRLEEFGERIARQNELDHAKNRQIIQMNKWMNMPTNAPDSTLLLTHPIQKNAVDKTKDGT